MLFQKEIVNDVNGAVNGVNGEAAAVNGGSTATATNGHASDYPTTPPPPFPPVGRKRDLYIDTSTFEVIDQTAISGRCFGN